jgi:hypothetical protein
LITNSTSIQAEGWVSETVPEIVTDCESDNVDGSPSCENVQNGPVESKYPYLRIAETVTELSCGTEIPCHENARPPSPEN